MIKAILHRGDKAVLLLGLSRVNVERLTGGEPIEVNLADIGKEDLAAVDKVILHYGETEDSLIEELTEKMGKPRKVHLDLKLP